MSKGYMYILECSDGSYYTGSTKYLEKRLSQHQAGEGANHTKKRLPVKLRYYEEYPRIDYAFYREKQVQGWSRKKKEALINCEFDKLPELAIAYRDKKGGFENLSHPNPLPEPPNPLPEAPNPLPEALDLLPEALEGNTIPLPEALEGNTNINFTE